eukprot:TRINITY_DN41994_c0_g1_i1.p1 TRINITY_DN41994_c0_g1~~TRINITY_DN41994_c0_g1_i1.p1  ORF type:complete len:111 (+),score=15.30 TRINITY_DN41994_c0_g1_i1:46-378(+)
MSAFMRYGVLVVLVACFGTCLTLPSQYNLQNNKESVRNILQENFPDIMEKLGPIGKEKLVKALTQPSEDSILFLLLLLDTEKAIQYYREYQAQKRQEKNRLRDIYKQLRV